MSDLPPPEDELPQQTTTADLAPQLKDFVGNLGPDTSEWGKDAATLVNDFVTRRDIVENANAQGDAFAGGVRQFSDSLSAMIRADPTFTNTALGLTALSVPRMIAEHPFVPDEQRGPTADALASEMAKEMARTSVVSWAQRSGDAAHNELSRLSGLFSEPEVAALKEHINLLDDARAQDTAGAVAARGALADTADRQQTHGFLDRILSAINPVSAAEAAEPISRQTVNDQQIGPASTAALYAARQKLIDDTKSGVKVKDILDPATEGNTIADLLKNFRDGTGHPRDIADAVTNGDLTGPAAKKVNALAQNPTMLRALLGHMDSQERVLLGPDHELEDGKPAYGILMQRALIALETVGPAAFDPNAPGYVGRGGVRGDDLTRRMAVEAKAEGQQRRLEDIFAQRRQRGENAQARIAAEQQRMQIAEEQRTLGQMRQEADRQHMEAQREEARQQRQQERDTQLAERSRQAQETAIARLNERRQQRDEANVQARVREASRLASERSGARKPEDPGAVFEQFLRRGRPQRG